MRLTTAAGTDLWLAYGTNVHAGGSADALERAIEETAIPLRDRLGVRGPFGVSLRLDRAGALALRDDDARRARLRERLASARLVPFTGNGFVAGDFHAVGTKADVYRPTWLDPEREAYTLAFADVLTSLRGPGEVASLSTAPISFKPFGEPREATDRAANRLAVVARRLRALEEATGTRVVLGIEPEPLCTIETVDEAVRFFRGPLRKAFGRDRAAEHHLGLCYDVCHQAVEGEDPAEGLARLEEAGVPVAKVQASCAIEVPDPRDEGARAALARFDEPRWLHQVVGGAPDDLARAADLPEALDDPTGRWRERRPWRVHFHVPVHRTDLGGGLRTTRAALDAALARVARGDVTDHLELETYTWEALGAADREGATLVESLAREYEHVLAVLDRHCARRAEPAA